MNQSKRKILIIDDSKENLQILFEFFKNSDYEIIVAVSGEEGEKLVFDVYPDIILLDVRLPGMSGFDLCRRLKNDPVHCRIPVIFTSGLTDLDSKLEGFEVGGADYLTKPFELHEVLTRVNNQISLVEAREVQARINENLESLIMQRTSELEREVNIRREREHELEVLNHKMAVNQSRIIQTEKMASIGQIAAGVAHEINNPTGFIRSNLGSLQDYLSVMKKAMLLVQEVVSSSPDDAKEKLEVLKSLCEEEDLDFIIEDLDALLAESIDGADRIKDIVNNLKSFAHSGDQKIVAANINDAIESTLKIVWNELKYKCEIVKEFEELPQVVCCIAKINQVFLNLLINASQSIEKEGVITIRTCINESNVVIEIGDTGCGIPQDNLESLFEPFFTTKEAGVGTGLGLAISKDIILEHNGMIEVNSTFGEGTVFTITLPLEYTEEVE